MDRGSPWYYFSPEGIGSLGRREAIGERIYIDDVQRVIDANPDAISSPALQPWVRRLKAGEFKCRRGRPRADRHARMVLAPVLYEDIRQDIWEARRGAPAYCRKLTDLEPCRQAAEQVIRIFGFHCTPEAFLNAMTKAKRDNFVHSERSRAFFMNEIARR
jgi:hypothetical protein